MGRLSGSEVWKSGRIATCQKKENAKVPQCLSEKETVIMAALKHF